MKILWTTLTVILSLPCAAAEPMTAMVWGGGATREEADVSLSAFEAREKTWAGALALAKGFPQIVESQNVAGMKPGFVVVLLGYCAEAESAATLELLKQFETSIYGRPVQGGEASCPKLAAGFDRRAERVQKTKEGELRGLFLNYPRGLMLLLQLHTRAGVLVESPVFTDLQLRGEGSGCSMDVAEKGIAITRECSIPQGCPAVGSETGEVRYFLKDGKIERKYVVLSHDLPPCRGE